MSTSWKPVLVALVVCAAGRLDAQSPACANGAIAAARMTVASLPAGADRGEALRRHKLSLDNMIVAQYGGIIREEWTGYQGPVEIGQERTLCLAGDSMRVEAIRTNQRIVDKRMKIGMLLTGGSLALLLTGDSDALVTGAFMSMGGLGFALSALPAAERRRTPRRYADEVLSAYNTELERELDVRAVSRKP